MSLAMTTLAKTASLSTLGLPSGDHWVRFHVEGDTISYEIANTPLSSAEPPTAAVPQRKFAGFVEKWGGTARKIDDLSDAWISHINEKHLK